MKTKINAIGNLSIIAHKNNLATRTKLNLMTLSIFNTQKTRVASHPLSTKKSTTSRKQLTRGKASNAFGNLSRALSANFNHKNAITSSQET
jgi:hypothetical protein